MDRRTAIVLGVIFGGLFLALFAFLALAIVVVNHGKQEGYVYGRGSGSGDVGVVEVKGPIAESEKTVRDLHRFLEDDSIKAVIVRVDSPGGAVAPSQEIHAEVIRLKQKKPVVISMGSAAASGGYYLAAGASHIVANPGTITGSIGVIAQLPNLTEIADKVGFRMNTVKSGSAKDLGNPFRPFSETDRDVFQGLIDDVFGQFVRAVAEGRDLPEAEVLAIADGRILTGKQAMAAGLVDQLGNFEDAVVTAGELGGVEGKPRLVHPPKEPTFPFERFLSESVREAVRAGIGELRGQLQGEAQAPAVRYLLPGY
ncbi:MAG TPA: signal peptide peptidase SppA [Vulgatibacter sp.]